MPGFVRTKKDEARWSRAKDAAKKSKQKGEDSFADQDWALVNHIYHQMGKAENLGKGIRDFFELQKGSNDASSLDELKSFLEKARRRMSDEPVDPDEEGDVAPEEAGMREFDPEGDDEGAKWLEANDPEKSQSEEYDPEAERERSDEEPEEDDFYNEYGPEEDEETHQQSPDVADQPVSDNIRPEAGAGEEEPEGGSDEQVPPQAQEVKQPGRFPQPTKDEIAKMRAYTRPWEQQARDKTALEAQAHKNPVLFHQGKMIESRNLTHRDRQKAYEEFKSSPDYQKAGPTKKMRLDAQFDKDWISKNPDYLKNAVEAHGNAHKAGSSGKDAFASAKDEQIQHILQGGAQPDMPMSVEEGLQHAGGTKGEEGTEGSMVQDPAASFAAGNKEFLAQYAKVRDKKAKKPKSADDMMNYDEASKADLSRILGDHPALKDPAKKAEVDSFFAKYYPLIGMSTQRVLNKLGIDRKRGDIDLGAMDEAGMHGLFQAINDYDHDHPSQASFATHAGNKIRGLQQTALKSFDQIPQEMRSGAKKYNFQAMAAKAPPKIADSLNRINAFKQAATPKAPKPEGEGGGESGNI